MKNSHTEARRHGGRRLVGKLHCPLCAENRSFDVSLCLCVGIFVVIGAMLYPAYLHSSDFSDEPRGNAAMAERYALRAKSAIDEGLWREALAGLERASDFADVSSDISYLLALARSHENRPRLEVLEALERALQADRWNLYQSEAARLFKAEQLIAIRAYSEALIELSRVSKSPREAELTLKALSASRPVEFRAYMKEALDRHPRESGPVRVFLSFVKNEDAKGRNPTGDDLEILELIIRRLPVLLGDDPELAWITAPFMRDTAEARRLVAAYRAANVPLPASLPAALNLGVIGEEAALEELFRAGQYAGGLSLDIALLEEVWALLRREEARELFRRNLSVYSGVITEDEDRDGIPETYAEYHEGMLTLSYYDTTQDGVPELIVYFEAGLATRALALMPPESRESSASWETAVSREIALSLRKEAAIWWERYPAILEVELDGASFIPRPLDFHFSPVKFFEFWGSGVFFPQLDDLSPPLTLRVLVSQSLRVERPSLEFRGGIEVVELNQGIPVRAREYVGGLMVSET